MRRTGWRRGKGEVLTSPSGNNPEIFYACMRAEVFCVMLHTYIHSPNGIFGFYVEYFVSDVINYPCSAEVFGDAACCMTLSVEVSIWSIELMPSPLHR